MTFHTVEIARQFMAMAKTTTGLKVTVEVLGGVYVKGKKVAADFSSHESTRGTQSHSSRSSRSLFASGS